jgi:O-antigen/teichoic acid export membrane protein
MLKLFSKELARYVPAQVVPAFLAILSVPLLTRILTVDEFGRYSLVVSSVAIMVALSGWLTMSMVRFYPAMPGKETALLIRTSFWVQLALAAAFGMAAFVAARLFWSGEAGLQELVIAGIVVFMVQSLFNLQTSSLQAQFQTNAYSLFSISSKTIGLGLGLLLTIVLHRGAQGMLWGAAGGMLICLPFLWRKSLKVTSLTGPISFPLLRDLASYGVPLVLGNLGAWVLSQADRYLVALYFSTQEVGVYSAAYWVSENSMKLMSVIFMLSSTPLLATTWEKKGQEASEKLLISVTRVYLLVAIPAAIGLSVLSVPLLRVLTGTAYATGYTVVPWVIAGAFFLGLQQRFNQVLLLLKRSRIVMIWLVISGALNVLLNVLFLRRFGYQVAAINTLVSYAFLCGALAVASSRHFHWNFPWTTTLRSLAAAGVMSVVIALLNIELQPSPVWSLGLSVPLGVLVYGALIWALGELSPEERTAVQLGLRRSLARRAGS